MNKKLFFLSMLFNEKIRFNHDNAKKYYARIILEGKYYPWHAYTHLNECVNYWYNRLHIEYIQ